MAKRAFLSVFEKTGIVEFAQGLTQLGYEILSTGGTAIVTADHGNAELMSFDDGAPCTSHTTNPVPFIVAGDKYIGRALKKSGALCDVAPTLLEIMGIAKPAEMDGESMLD